MKVRKISIPATSLNIHWTTYISMYDFQQICCSLHCSGERSFSHLAHEAWFCRRSGNGGPQTFLPATHGAALRMGPYGPSSSTRHSRPSRGGRHKTSSGGSRDVSHDDRDQAGASARSVLVSSFVSRGQAQAQSTEASSKGFHIGATRP